MYLFCYCRVPTVSVFLAITLKLLYLMSVSMFLRGYICAKT